MICVVSLWGGGRREATGSEGEATVLHILGNQKVIDFPMTYPTPQSTPHPSQTAGVVSMHTISHLQTRSSNPDPYPPPRPCDHLLYPYLSLAVSLLLPLSHLCLCRAAAAQRTEGAAFTSEHISHQMSPFAASPSNIQADNAPCILNI